MKTHWYWHEKLVHTISFAFSVYRVTDDLRKLQFGIKSVLWRNKPFLTEIGERNGQVSSIKWLPWLDKHVFIDNWEKEGK